MKALQLAKELEVVSWKDAQDEAALMIRRQHAMITKLRSALQNTTDALQSETVEVYSPYADEIVFDSKKLLKDTEEFE